jgi:transposase, IS30 family
MQSIHARPPGVEDRLIPAHREGDLIKGAGNRSSTGTLVERTSGFVTQRRIEQFLRARGHSPMSRVPSHLVGK